MVAGWFDFSSFGVFVCLIVGACFSGCLPILAGFDALTIVYVCLLYIDMNCLCGFLC